MAKLDHLQSMTQRKNKAKRTIDVLNPNIQVSRLWGTESEYGIEYPEGYEYEHRDETPRVEYELPGGGGYSGDPLLAGKAVSMMRGEREDPELQALIEKRKNIEKETAEIVKAMSPELRREYEEIIKKKRKKPEKTGFPSRETFINEFVLPRMDNGLDPYTVNPYEEGDKEFEENKPMIMKQLFPNIPLNGILTEDQEKFKRKELEKARQFYVNRSIQRVELNKTLYHHMVSDHDRMKKEREKTEKEQKELLKERLKETKAEGRAAEFEYKKKLKLFEKSIEGEKDITKLSDFKFAFKLWKKRNPEGTVERFRKEIWEKPTGGLNEGAVIKSIDDMSLATENPTKWASDAYNKYLSYRELGLSRENALNKVRQTMTEIKLPTEIKTTSEAMEYLKSQGMNEQQAKDWLRSKR